MPKQIALCDIITAIFFIIIVKSIASEDTTCGHNQEYSECAPLHRTHCKNYKLTQKHENQCKKGCKCLEGYIWHNKKCISTKFCNFINSIPKCGVNQTYQTQRIIMRSCDSLIIPYGDAGCYCKEKYYLNRVTKKCILKKECPSFEQKTDKTIEPRRTENDQFCPHNEELHSCKDPCEPFCYDPNRYSCKRGACKSGCVCKRHLIRAANGTCVPQSDCTEKNVNLFMNITCSEYELNKSCGPSFEGNCSNPTATYGRFPCTTGCFCREGYTRMSDHGPCIPVEFCKDVPRNGNNKF